MNRIVLASLPLALAAGCLSVDLDDRPCADDTECLDTHVCAADKCMPRSITVESLTAPSYCHEVFPADTVANALEDGQDLLLFGTLLPTSEASGNQDKGLAREKAIKLAAGEIDELGLVNDRRVGFVMCDSASDSEQATLAARFLAEYVGAPATIGAAQSGVTGDALNDGAAPNGMLLISPSATSPRLSDADDNDLFWRTAPSDAFQGTAIAQVLIDQGVGSVAVFSGGEAYGNGLRDFVRDGWCVPDGETDLCLADASRYMNRTLSDDDEQTEQERTQEIEDAISDMQGFDPAAIVVAAQIDVVLEFLDSLSGTALASKLVVLPDAAKNDRLLEVDDDTLLGNVLGTGPATPTGPIFGRFASLYGETPPPFTANAYDATWMITLAAAAADAGDGISGVDIRDGLRRLSGGVTEVPAGPDQFRTGENVLNNDGAASVDFEGASGPLDFPTGATEAPADLGAWYVDTAGGSIENYPGTLYEAATGTITNPLAP